MDIRRLFTQQLNFRYVNQLVDSGLFDGLGPTEDGAAQKPMDARVMFEGKGVQVLRITLSLLRGDIEKGCIRLLRKHYPDAVYLFADATGDTEKTSYHLCNDAGKQLVLTPEKQRLFTEKVAFFEVTDDVTGTLDLKERIAKAFETEKITKQFYNDFKTYRALLEKFIEGIPVKEDRLWYVSVLLNRLMFIYFIQKHGLIGGKKKYLLERLAEYEKRGANFYADFLKPLFFVGFASRKGQRGEYEVAFADVPYLNGGLFVKHTLEEQYPQIGIDNNVLRKLLDYFDKYHWYLDDRPLRDENEINPDVLGYIFEQYVNQKQMGAYYTREDITGYICKYTILPFLLDKLAHLQGRWRPEGAPLPMPIDGTNIERYLYDAVQTKEYLPTETEREYTQRRKRYAQIKQDAVDGEITWVNDLITNNLDVVTYADDVIAEMNERALWQFYFYCLKPLTVLDPTSGSGAFLFAALNILLPLYLACLKKMRRFVVEDTHKRSQHTPDFRAELERIEQHDNERYYVVKTIIVNNLYGVDIMEEATEICKLRLFLRMASEISDPERIEPLPDIDFNIKAGNSLVGYTSINEIEALYRSPKSYQTGSFTPPIVEKIKQLVREMKGYRELQLQLNAPPSLMAEAKAQASAQLEKITQTLDQHLLNSKQIRKVGKNGKFNTQPLHWYVAFNDILADGGFDVIVGNPPYVVYSTAKVDYSVHSALYKTLPAKNLYAFVFERAMALAKATSPIGLIVQLTVLSSENMPSLQDLLAQRGSLYAIPFPRRPESIFDGVEMPVAILLASYGAPGLFTTSRVMRFYTEERNTALSNLNFVMHRMRIDGHRIAKIGSLLEKSALEKVLTQSIYIDSLIDDGSQGLVYYQEACRYWVKAFLGTPFFKRNGESMAPPHGRIVNFKSKKAAAFAACILNSSTFYWLYSVLSDCEHINDKLIRHLPIPSEWGGISWIQLSNRLSESMAQYAKRKTITTSQGHIIEYDEMKAVHSKPIIDEIDCILAKLYGFSEEELDFILNYDIKYRMGQNNSADEESDEEV
jgi:hypothetical protein